MVANEDACVDNGVVDMVTLASRVRDVARGWCRVFVGIDGPGGSGKSTFAEQLAAAMGNAYVVHGDDFYLPCSRRQERLGEAGAGFDLRRLAEQVVVPGAAGEALRYQRYDWVRDELAAWIEVPAGAPVVLEGVFCLVSQLREAYTFTIWCRTEPALRLARGLLRDGESARSQWVEVWMPAEDAYAASQHPERSADLVVESLPAMDSQREFREVGE